MIILRFDFTLSQVKTEDNDHKLNNNNNSSKKRNPYSIEEILKKPGKRLRLNVEVTASPKVLMHSGQGGSSGRESNFHRSGPTSNDLLHHSDTEENTDIEDEIKIEVCD